MRGDPAWIIRKRGRRFRAGQAAGGSAASVGGSAGTGAGGSAAGAGAASRPGASTAETAVGAAGPGVTGSGTSSLGGGGSAGDVATCMAGLTEGGGAWAGGRAEVAAATRLGIARPTATPPSIQGPNIVDQ